MNVAKDKMKVIAGGKTDGPDRGGGSGGGGWAGKGDWRDLLVRNKEGDVKATPHNIVTILENDESLKGMFGLDEFANRVAVHSTPPWSGGSRDEFSEVDAVELSAWVGHPSRYRMVCKPTQILEAVEAVARRHRFHPVQQYLNSLAWDGTERLATMFRDFFGSDDTNYCGQAARVFMLSAVARILKPGCKVDTMLVLEGPQGAGKTRVTRELFDPRWYAEAMESPASKDFYQALAGKWGVEIGEMESFTKAEVNKVKQALSAQQDTYRPSYGRYTRSFPRQCVFIGTTNDDHYLRDPTGARRFLPVRVTVINVDGLIHVRDQLWAEAVARYKRGESWWELPGDAPDQQDARFMEDSWSEPVSRWLGNKCDSKRYPSRITEYDQVAGPIDWTTTTELLFWALAIDVGKHGKPEQMRLSQLMKRLGWVQVRETVDGKRERRWVRSGKGGADDVPF